MSMLIKYYSHSYISKLVGTLMILLIAMQEINLDYRRKQLLCIFWRVTMTK